MIYLITSAAFQTFLIALKMKRWDDRFLSIKSPQGKKAHYDMQKTNYYALHNATHAAFKGIVCEGENMITQEFPSQYHHFFFDALVKLFMILSLTRQNVILEKAREILGISEEMRGVITFRMFLETHKHTTIEFEEMLLFFFRGMGMMEALREDSIFEGVLGTLRDIRLHQLLEAGVILQESFREASSAILKDLEVERMDMRKKEKQKEALFRKNLFGGFFKGIFYWREVTLNFWQTIKNKLFGHH